MTFWETDSKYLEDIALKFTIFTSVVIRTLCEVGWVPLKSQQVALRKSLRPPGVEFFTYKTGLPIPIQHLQILSGNAGPTLGTEEASHVYSLSLIYC